jgi:hypothetical protein
MFYSNDENKNMPFLIFNPHKKASSGGFISYFGNAANVDMVSSIGNEFCNVYNGMGAMMTISESSYSPGCETIAGVQICNGTYQSRKGDESEYYLPNAGFCGFYSSYSLVIPAYAINSTTTTKIWLVESNVTGSGSCMGTMTQVRFSKTDSYTSCTHMAIADEKNEELAIMHEFGSSWGMSDYYEIPAGNLFPVFWNPSNTSWTYCLPSPFTYKFAAECKYTVVCDDDGTYLTFHVEYDGTY